MRGIICLAVLERLLASFLFPLVCGQGSIALFYMEQVANLMECLFYQGACPVIGIGRFCLFEFSPCMDEAETMPARGNETVPGIIICHQESRIVFQVGFRPVTAAGRAVCKQPYRWVFTIGDGCIDPHV